MIQDSTCSLSLLLCKALANTMLGLFQENSFLLVLQEGNKMKKPLVAFSHLMIQQYGELKESPHDMELLEHKCGQPVFEAMGRMISVCRAILHFFCEDLKVHHLDPLSDQDVHYWKGLVSERFPEKSIAKAFNKEGSFWIKEYQEIVEKGGAAALTSEKLQELQDMLDNDVADTELGELKSMTALYQQVCLSMRSQRLTQMREKLKVSSRGTFWQQFQLFCIKRFFCWKTFGFGLQLISQ